MPKRRLRKRTHPAISQAPEAPDLTDPSQYLDEIDSYHQTRGSNLKLRASEGDFRDGLLSASEGDSSSGEREEVLPLQLSSSSEADTEEEIGAVREYFSDESEAGEVGWGRKKRTFYDTDFVGDEKKGRRQEETELALEEEREAISLQKRLTEGLTERDYLTHGLLSALTASRPDASHSGTKDETVLEESPELNELIQDLNSHLSRLNALTLPSLSLARDVTHPPDNLLLYLHTCSSLSFSYCCSILFYLSLRARGESVETHPVCERLVSYRSLIAQLSVLDKDLQGDLQLWLESREELSTDSDQLIGLNDGQALEAPDEDSQNTDSNSNSPDDKETPNSADKYASLTPLEFYDAMLREREEKKTRKQANKQANKQQNNNKTENPIADTENTKRAIDYKIKKNKGLTPKRKKELRNPRVRQRMRYKRALKHRKGQVPGMRPRSSLYPGEMTGIRDDLSKSRKIR